MNDQKMVHRANQIALYFQAYPQERAREGVYDHVQRFWPPSMRAQLAAYKADGGEGLHPLVAWTADRLCEASRPGNA